MCVKLIRTTLCCLSVFAFGEILSSETKTRQALFSIKYTGEEILLVSVESVDMNI